MKGASLFIAVDFSGLVGKRAQHAPEARPEGAKRPRLSPSPPHHYHPVTVSATNNHTNTAELIANNRTTHLQLNANSDQQANMELALCQSMDSVNTATTEEEVSLNYQYYLHLPIFLDKRLRTNGSLENLKL